MSHLLTKLEIVNILKTKMYPINEYWVTAGAGLVMHGVRPVTSDIDMGCSTWLVNLLIENGAKWSYLEDGNRRVKPSANIELFENWNADYIEIIDGIPVASLQSIRKQKVELNRKKDWVDIVLIDKFAIHLENRSLSPPARGGGDSLISSF